MLIHVSLVTSLSYSLATIPHGMQGTLIPLHVRTKKPWQCAVVPEFLENCISTRFILVATSRAKAYLLI